MLSSWKLFCLAILATVNVAAADWSPQLAASYLDQRQKEWFGWAPAKAPNGPCVSCHTGVTYLLARPALRRALGETTPTELETGLLDGLRARVGVSDPLALLPQFKKEPAASQALAVEAIHAALLLAMSGWGGEARLAFDRLWSLQARDGESRGAWEWLSLNLDPWEMPESRFYGAGLAAVAVGYAPEEYRKLPEARERITALAGYLNRELSGQPLHNRMVLLWASEGWTEVLPKATRKTIIEEIERQQLADGGWTMDSLGPWKEHASAPPSTGSNSYATGLAAFTLQKAGVARSHPRMKRALAWLEARQDRGSGSWPAESMNKSYKPESMQVRFMRDAATALASLALLAK